MSSSKYRTLVYALAVVALAATVVMSNSQPERAAQPATATPTCSAEACAACPNAATCADATATGKLTVDRARCNGCTRCTLVAPHTFAMDQERKAKVINPTGDSPEAIANAVAGCQKRVISYR